MNNLWIQGTPVLPSFNHSYEYNTSNKDSSGCPSYIHFGNTSYTLSFGHLFSGNLHCYQPFNPINQCNQSYVFELPECYSNTSQIENIQPKKTLIINDKVNEAMKTIRKTIKNVKKQCDYSIPSVPYCYNPIMNNCNQNNITKAAVLLEQAANAISIASNTQKPNF